MIKFRCYSAPGAFSHRPTARCGSGSPLRSRYFSPSPAIHSYLFARRELSLFGKTRSTSEALRGTGRPRRVAPTQEKTTSRAGRGLNTAGERRAELSRRAGEAIRRSSEGQPSPGDLGGSLLPVPGGALGGTRSSTHPPSYCWNNNKKKEITRTVSCGQINALTT